MTFIFPGNKTLACLVEIYQDPSRSNCYFCRMTLGKKYFCDPEFTPTGDKYEFPLNGPGKSKAKKRIKKHLFTMGHNLGDIVVLDNHRLVKEGDKFYVREKS